MHAGEMRVNSFVEFDRWYELEIVAVGGAIEVFLDGQKIIAYADPAPLPEGSFFIHAYDEALIDDLVVEAVEVK